VAQARGGSSTKSISVKTAEADEEGEPSGKTANKAGEPVLAYRVPESLPIETSARKLSKADIDRALTGYLQASTAALETNQSSDATIVVVRRVQVKKIHLEDNSGWAEIRFDSRSQLAPDGTWSKTKAEKVRWSLRHDEDRWQLLLPSDRVYVSQ
jgi:hypothetical protein